MPRKKAVLRAGREDEDGNLYLDELDLHRLLSTRLRIRHLKAEARAMRHQADFAKLSMQQQLEKLLRNAANFEETAKQLEKNKLVNIVKDLSSRYQVDFEDPKFAIDEDSGMIKDIG